MLQAHMCNTPCKTDLKRVVISYRGRRKRVLIGQTVGRGRMGGLKKMVLDIPQW